MIRALILAALLTGCAHTPPLAYGNGDPGIIVHGTLYWVGEPSEAEQQAWTEYHLEPVLDEQERAELSRYAWASAADSVTTIAGLGVCAGLRELNPIVAIVPKGYLIIPLSIGAYYLAKRAASRTSRYQEDMRGTRAVTVIRAVASVSNAFALARCL